MTTTAHPSWLVESDYDVDAFRELVSRKTDHADVPNATTIERNVPIYDGEALVRHRPRSSTPPRTARRDGVGARSGPRRARRAAWADRTQPARRGDRDLQRDHRRAARRRPGGRRPLRQAGLERPRLELTREARRACTRCVRRLLLGRRRSRSAARRGSARTTRSAPRSTASTRGHGAVPAPRLPRRVLHAGGDGPLPAPCAPDVAGADAAGSGRPHRHAARVGSDDAAAVLAVVATPGSSPRSATTSARCSTSSRCRCR